MEPDGDADLDDHAVFTECLEKVDPTPGCLQIFDGNENGWVDLGDFAEFQLSFTGSIAS